MMSQSSNNDAAFRAIADNFTTLKAFVHLLLRNYTLANDVFSETIIEILHAWPSYDQTKPFLPWAHVIARRVAYDHHRKRKRFELIPADDMILNSIGQELTTASGQPQLDARQEALRECVQRLPFVYRRQVESRFYEDCSYQQFATLTRRKIGTVYSIQSRLLQMLSQCVSRHLESR